MSMSDADRPLLITVRYADGEQFWKLWNAESPCGFRLRILSKRKADGNFIAGAQCEDAARRVCRSWITDGLPNEQALNAYVTGFTQQINQRSFKFKCLDLSNCKRLDQFMNAVMESPAWSFLAENVKG